MSSTRAAKFVEPNRFNRLKINASVTSSVQEFTRIKKEIGRHHYPSKRMKSTFQTTGSIALDDSSVKEETVLRSDSMEELCRLYTKDI